MDVDKVNKSRNFLGFKNVDALDVGVSDGWKDEGEMEGVWNYSRMFHIIPYSRIFILK